MKSSLTEKWIVCRICLKQPKEVMQTIFDGNEEKDLTRMVLECGGVPIKKYDHFPDKICSKCLKYLRVAYKFRVTCQRSHKHLSRFISAPVVVDRADASEVPELALELDEVEELAMKLEPEEALVGIKQELCENGEDGVVDVYEPMDEGSEAFEEFDTIDRSDSTMSDDIEYLEEFDDNVSTSDEEFLPTTTRASAKKSQAATAAAAKSKLQKQQVQKAAAQAPKIQRLTVIRKERLTGAKRGPKPKKIKETSFICDMCGNIYPTQGRLTEHIKLHKGIKPHECEICGHAFAQTQQLARHMNTHTGNRPYKCSYCPAAFADLSTRNKHHRIHTNERPYVCDVCGKSFTYTNTLKFHKMIHTGEKPHVCDICGKGFQQAYKLRNHKMTHEKKGVKLEKIEVEQLDDNYQEVNVATAQILEI